MTTEIHPRVALNHKSFPQPEGRPILGSDAMRGPLWDIVAHTAPDSEGDAAGMYFYLLSGCSAIMGRGVAFKIRNQVHPLGISTLFLGDSGNGKKGTASGEMDYFLRLIDPQFMGSRNIIPNISSGEGLVALVRDPEDDEQDDDEGSEEEFVGRGGRRGSLKPKKRELKPTKIFPGGQRFFVRDTEFQTNTMVALDNGTTAGVFRKVFDGDSLSTHAKGGSHYATLPHIVIHGQATPESFCRRMNGLLAEGGTYNRFLIAWVRRSQIVADPEVTDEWEATAEKLASIVAENIQKVRFGGDDGTTRFLRLSAGAKQIWVDYLYEELSTVDDDAMEVEQQFTTRQAPYCLRLAGLLAVASGHFEEIEAWHLKAAHAIIKYSTDSVRFVMERHMPASDSGSAARAVAAVMNPMDRVAGDVMTALFDAGTRGLTRTHISKKVLNSRVKADALTQMREDLMIPNESVPSPGSTKPVEMWWHPQFAGGDDHTGDEYDED